MRGTRVVGAVSIAWLTAACGAQSPGVKIPTEPQQDSLRARLTMPPGFTVRYYASGLPNVRMMAVAPDGSLYASRPSFGQVVRLLDTAGTGVINKVVVAVSGLDRPHGIAFHGGWMYIAWTSGVSRVHLGADGTATGAPEQIASFSGGGNHWSRSIVFGADSAMYIAIGSTCNLCVETAPERAAVMRYNADGSGGRRFAFGLRNAVGIAVNPTTKELWVSQNERDEIQPSHEDLPPEEINILFDGGDYGWPYCYSLGGHPVPNPEYNDAARCAPTFSAALEMQAHSAPLGITFLDRATMFPAAYRSDLLVAFHGSWDRAVPTGAKVIRVHVANGRPTGYEDFISGWQRADGTRWGRPVDVIVAADGSVLISDDLSGSIYRVTH